MRVRGPGNGHGVRASAAEKNVVLYRVVGGRRTQIGGADVAVLAEEWQSLRIVVEGPRFRVWFGDKLLFEAADAAIPDAGRIGLWTKSDSVTLFDDLAYARLTR